MGLYMNVIVIKAIWIYSLSFLRMNLNVMPKVQSCQNISSMWTTRLLVEIHNIHFVALMSASQPPPTILCRNRPSPNYIVSSSTVKVICCIFRPLFGCFENLSKPMKSQKNTGIKHLSSVLVQIKKNCFFCKILQQIYLLFLHF